MTTAARVVSGDRFNAAVALLLLVAGWAVIWTQTLYLNPVAFSVLWTGAALTMWRASGRYPGVKRHLALAAVSVPLWWYFELVNDRSANWSYIGADRYSATEFALFASLAFATVVPAIVASTALIRRVAGRTFLARVAAVSGTVAAARPRSVRPVHLVGAGLAAEAAMLALPDVFYPLVWVAPFLVLDGLVAAAGGRSVVADLAVGVWGRAAVIAGAGLLSGGLWEFWNFWAYPKWVYDVPLLDFGKVFEMPILGYGGYIPFAWSVIQAVTLTDLLAARMRSRAGVPGTAS